MDWNILFTFISVCSILVLGAEDPATDKLVWYNITQPYLRGALCNDFTPAGYFIRKSTTLGSNFRKEEGDLLKPYDKDSTGSLKIKQKWVIFLEGGGVCTTPSSCNQRYIDRNIRNEYQTYQNGVLTVDTVAAWNAHKNDPQVMSKLMTSLWRFKNGNMNNSSSSMWTIEGRDLLSTSRMDNPDFYDYNHVLIPYCSSDLWLKKTDNFRKAWSKSFTFQFHPDAVDEHQFTFRGAAIFRSVINDLYTFHDFSKASEVLLAGSGTGGLGAVNHAYWLNEQLQTRQTVREVRLYILLDSAWFVDFNGAISSEYSLSELNELIASKQIISTCSPVVTETSEVSIIDQNDSNDWDDQGNRTVSTIPCLSVQSLLETGRFPADVPILVIFGRYNIYYLLKALASIINLDEVC